MNYTIEITNIDAVQYRQTGTSQITVMEDPQNTGEMVLPFSAKYVDVDTHAEIIKPGVILGVNEVLSLPIGRYNVFVTDSSFNPKIVQTGGAIIKIALPVDLVNIINVIP